MNKAVTIDSCVIPAIIRAINAHDALTAALANLVKWMDDSGQSKTKPGGVGVMSYEGHEFSVVTDARAALEAAA